MTKVRVFLVDDHLLAREGIRALLETDEQITIVGEAASAEEALERLPAARPNVVLMDIQLPGKDGIQTTREIHTRQPDTKVVILSSHGDDYLNQAIEAGANGYLLKTASQAELVQAVHAAASGESPLDPGLASGVFRRVAELAKGDRPRPLTDRQLQVLRLVADGVPSQDITGRLAISQATLTRELRHIFDFLGVNDRAAAVAEAYRRKLL